MTEFRGTTICAVKRNGVTAIAGDGQVTMGEKDIMKGTAHKVRKIYDGKVVVGFANKLMNFGTKLIPLPIKLKFIAGRWSRIRKDSF